VVAGALAAGATLVLPHETRAGRGLLLVLVMSLAAASGLAAIAPVQKVRVLAAHDFAVTPEARRAFQWHWNRAYRSADEDLARLARGGDVVPGPMFVFGDPVLLLRANRSQAVPILGWGPEFLDDRAWRELHADLRAVRPAYIVVEDDIRAITRERYPAVLEFIESTYVVAFRGASGTWYVRP
jgi:hypothetical protein